MRKILYTGRWRRSISTCFTRIQGTFRSICDGLTVGEYMTPRLTTVVQPIAELAVKSIHLLLDQIENRVTPRYETVPVTLAQKESTKEI